MKITRRQLRRMLHEASDEFADNAKKLADQFLIGGADTLYHDQLFILAVSLGHAKEGTFSVIDSIGRPIISFVASPALRHELKLRFGGQRLRSARVEDHPGMYKIAYAV